MSSPRQCLWFRFSRAQSQHKFDERGPAAARPHHAVTFQFITSMQEMLQDQVNAAAGGNGKTQADLLFRADEVLRLQQTQEAGSIFIKRGKESS